jgi:hypothetical protein
MAGPHDPPTRDWLFDATHPAPPALGPEFAESYLADETSVLDELLERAALPTRQTARVKQEAHALVTAIRAPPILPH